MLDLLGEREPDAPNYKSERAGYLKVKAYKLEIQINSHNIYHIIK